MTGLYSSTVSDRRRKAYADIRRARASLETLQNHGSEYAREHQAIVALFEDVAKVWALAADELPSLGRPR